MKRKTSKEENRILGETEKMIIFVHKAVQFNIGKSITEDTTIIPPALEEWQGTGESIFYYMLELREAAKSDKKYIIMEFEPIVGETIKALMLVPEQYNFYKWNFFTFFNADSCPAGEKYNPMYYANDDKMSVLLDLFNYPFIFNYTIPIGYYLEAEDLEKMKKDISGPRTEKDFRRMMWNIRKGKKPERLSFPFYETDYERLKVYIESLQQARL